MYQELIQLVKSAAEVYSAAGTLDWEHHVSMPKGELVRRSAVLTRLQTIGHTMLTDPRIGELLASIDRTSLSDDQRANVEEIEHSYRRAVLVPKELIEAVSSHAIMSNEAWERARESDDFEIFRPFLERTIELSRDVALAIDPSRDPYETMLDDHERGTSVEEYSRMFKSIAEGIRPLVHEIAERAKIDTSILDKDLNEELQMKYQKQLLQRIGYDFNKGRLDTAIHPFCGEGGRITTRFSDGWYKAIGSSIHEHGHAKYEHQLPEGDWGTPLGTWRSMGVHESQSRLWENHVGLSMDFWIGEYPHVRTSYAPLLDGLDLDTFYRYINTVEPGLIRTNADELTYPMHIIVRFELEQAMVSGTLKASDLPSAWRELMKKHLGVEVPSDKLGCLQDVHWTGGFGYFPTYTYGSMIAAQLWETLEKSVPDVGLQMRHGSFEAISAWLKEHVHRHGCRYSTSELVLRATGELPNTRAYISHLNTKFRRLYGLQNGSA